MDFQPFKIGSFYGLCRLVYGYALQPGRRVE